MRSFLKEDQLKEPEGFSDKELAAMFSDFFENKIENLIGGFVEEAQLDLHPVVG